MLDALIWVKAHRTTQVILKWQFIGESWIVLDRLYEQLIINVAEFDGAVVELPGETWIQTYRFKSVGFHDTLDVLPFMRDVLAEFERLFLELGASGWSKMWGFDYPAADVDRLRESLVS